MPIRINGGTYYRTAEACAMVGVSKSTLLRWLGKGILKDTLPRDRRGWRLFTPEDVRIIEEEAYKVK